MEEWFFHRLDNMSGETDGIRLTHMPGAKGGKIPLELGDVPREICLFCYHFLRTVKLLHHLASGKYTLAFFANAFQNVFPKKQEKAKIHFV